MGRILFAEKDGIYVLKLVGDVRMTCGPTISNFLENLKTSDNFLSVIIDLSETTGIDSTSLGMLAKISIVTQETFNTMPTIVSTNDDISRILMSMGFEQIFVIIEDTMANYGKLGELPQQVLPEKLLREEVLEAHRTLMALNESNRDTFQDLVLALTEEQEQAVDKKLASC